VNWRDVHVGFEKDGLKIAGLDVWKHEWRSAGLPSVELPHPSYRDQKHPYSICEIGDAAHPVRFAVCELSNGVWGFYVPA
jgi:hypothetical protein